MKSSFVSGILFLNSIKMKHRMQDRLISALIYAIAGIILGIGIAIA
ncbi:hypothetical protein ACI8B_50288 [Acinetobacter proteolyticus]|uniref:Uncharacterized protein n=1 Tax=Acinetobacter proteolyticus TaxID=1776741 RepID=A0A653K9Y7_9GAMM|nr:hypothetical protein ACI8B_50288 [Acinetobacter proteolyticus]